MSKHYSNSIVPGIVLLTQCATCGLADAPASVPKAGFVSDKCDKCRKDGKRTNREAEKAERAAKKRERQKTASLYVPEGNDLVIPEGEIDDFKPDPKGKLLSDEKGVKRWGFECWECGKQFVKRQAEGQRKPRARKYCSGACKQKQAERNLNARVAAGDEAAMDAKYNKQSRYRRRRAVRDMRIELRNKAACPEGKYLDRPHVSTQYTRNVEPGVDLSQNRSWNMGGKAVVTYGRINPKWVQPGDPREEAYSKPLPCRFCGKPVEVDYRPLARITDRLVTEHFECREEYERNK